MRRPTLRDVRIWEEVDCLFAGGEHIWRMARGCKRREPLPTLEELDRRGEVALDHSTGLLTIEWRRE